MEKKAHRTHKTPKKQSKQEEPSLVPLPNFKPRGSRYLEENEFKGPSINEEEMRKYALPEDLSEIEKCKILLKKRDNLQ